MLSDFSLNGVHILYMDPEPYIEPWLDDQRRQGLFRVTSVVPSVFSGEKILNFASNDYLNLACAPALKKAATAALQTWGTGATASRLLVGTLPVHAALEERIAACKGAPAALVFGSGYLTNAGVIPALAGRGDHVFADRLAHASILDAAQLSRARLSRFRHNDPEHLEALLKKSDSSRRLIVTESVFSMDGDLAPLNELAELALRYDALLMVDEAHATGVFGPCGSGLIVGHGLQDAVHLSMGTLSKALGGYGGFVACSASMRDWLVNRARTFIYTTGLPPCMAACACRAFDLLRENPHWGQELLARAQRFRTRLDQAGLDTLRSRSQIVPVLIGDCTTTSNMAARLRDKGIVAAAIRPPTIPEGTARLRLSVTLAHSDADLDYAAQVVAAAAHEEGLL